jgi:hypothetical protein
VTLDLCAAENARSAAASILLQRLLRAVPSAMPAQHLCASTFDVVARSECVEATAPHACTVLLENELLGIGAEMRHRGRGLQLLQVCALSHWSSVHGGKRIKSLHRHRATSTEAGTRRQEGG